MPTVYCTKCGVAKPADLEHFNPDRRKANGLNSWCRECNRAASRTRQAARRSDPAERPRLLDEKRRHAHSERGRARKRAFSQAENHRRRHAVFEWSLAQWRKCLADWDGCAYCGSASGPFEHDHYIPVSAPDCPGTVPWNIVPACRACSRSKGARRPEQWVQPDRLVAILRYLEGQRR